MSGRQIRNCKDSNGDVEGISVGGTEISCIHGNKSFIQSSLKEERTNDADAEMPRTLQRLRILSRNRSASVKNLLTNLNHLPKLKAKPYAKKCRWIFG